MNFKELLESVVAGINTYRCTFTKFSYSEKETTTIGGIEIEVQLTEIKPDSKPKILLGKKYHVVAALDMEKGRDLVRKQFLREVFANAIYGQPLTLQNEA